MEEMVKQVEVRFIDLFAGIGGLRLAFESACKEKSLKPNCVFTSEIKAHALKVYRNYFGNHVTHGDITKIPTSKIPDFDFLLAGFPCQAFSSAGKRQGFMDTRGTLFFEIERILKAKRPYGFILENVEGLIKHDRVDKKKQIGGTLETILGILNDLGYKVNYALLNSRDFGLPQDRKRVVIVGTKDMRVALNGFSKEDSKLSNILEKGLPTMDTKLTRALLSHYKITELYGKAIKDKRGGDENIHSWDIELKGSVSTGQKELLGKLLKERRKRHWAKKKGIKWMDGMPLTEGEISTFFKAKNLRALLVDLVEKGYLRFEHPKELVEKRLGNGNTVTGREHHIGKEKGFNIVTGKLSFEISEILDPNGVAPTLVATDVSRLAVPDGNGLRRLTLREGLRIFGFPEDFELCVEEKEGFDLLGNTVAVPMFQAIASRAIEK
jgi:DNA (cytosine-5)-methyltransferase 1